MFNHPAAQIDFRPYAGHLVAIGCAPGEKWQRGVTYYVLGTIDNDLPEHVKAIIVDDAVESSELLFVVRVDDGGTVLDWAPLVVFDDHGTLRYGLEFLHAIVETHTSSQSFIVRGVHLPE